MRLTHPPAFLAAALGSAIQVTTGLRPLLSATSHSTGERNAALDQHRRTKADKREAKVWRDPTRSTRCRRADRPAKPWLRHHGASVSAARVRHDEPRRDASSS